MREGLGLQEKDSGYEKRIWATGERYGLQEKDLSYRRRIWATGEGFELWEKDAGAGDGSWGCRRILGL